MYQGELMLSAASKIFSVTISILPLRASHRLLPPAVADRVAALPMKEDRRGKIKSYPPATHSDFNRGCVESDPNGEGRRAEDARFEDMKSPYDNSSLLDRREAA